MSESMILMPRHIKDIYVYYRDIDYEVMQIYLRVGEIISEVEYYCYDCTDIVEKLEKIRDNILEASDKISENIKQLENIIREAYPLIKQKRQEELRKWKELFRTLK